MCSSLASRSLDLEGHNGSPHPFLETPFPAAGHWGNSSLIRCIQFVSAPWSPLNQNSGSGARLPAFRGTGFLWLLSVLLTPQATGGTSTYRSFPPPDKWADKRLRSRSCLINLSSRLSPILLHAPSSVTTTLHAPRLALQSV